MNVAMLNRRVLLKADEGEEKTRSGMLYVPDTAKDAPQTATVRATWGEDFDEVGNKVYSKVDVGDKVIFPKYAGAEVTIDGELFLICKENELLAIVASEVPQSDLSDQQSE